jgi:hypothetical protein
VLGDDDSERKATLRLQRRLAAATRRRIEGGSAKSAIGGRKTKKLRAQSGRGGKLKSSAGKIPKSPGKVVQRRKRGQPVAPPENDAPPVMVIIAAVAVLVVLLFGALALLNK